MKIDQSKLNDYIKRITPPPCALCGHADWTMSDLIYQVQEYVPSKMRIERTSLFPVAMMVCHNCGNTYFINAIASGLMERPADEDSEPAGNEGND